MNVTALLAAGALFGAMAAEQGSVRAVLEQSPRAADGSITVVVRARVSNIELGAYQGTLRFAPGSVSVLRASAPSGDGTRVVNPADSASGILRFAGFTVTRFRSDTLLTVVLRPTQGTDLARLRVELDVASDVNGRALPRDSVLP